MGDPLARLDEVVDWEVFAAVLDGIPRVEAKGPGGRPAYEPMLLFKVLVIQSFCNHVKVDSKSKLIEAFVVTDAAVHDSQALEALLEVGDPKTYTDSAYAGKASEAVFAAKQVEGKVIERAYRNKQLTARQKKRNRAKSKIRVRVEHVFATMKMSMRRAWNRCVGRARNEAAIAMTNLVYNMVRFEQIERLGLRSW